MMHRFVAAVLVLFVWMNAALAQTADDVVWIQIEAQPNLRAATTSAQNYAAQLEDVNGFSLGGGWYGIALGPYRRNDAEAVLNAYRRDRLIPRDAYIAFSTSFRQQFYPVGANLLSRGVIDAPEVTADVAVEPVAEPTTEPAVEPVIAEITTEPADETPAQAQRSERALDRDQKKELQRMLKWAGFYDAAIDGSYGRGTRNSMAAWQQANNFETTGIMTTLQRATLLQQYNAVLADLGLEVVRDEAAGIEMQMPMAVVKFEKYESPFAQYSSTGDIDAKVLLISQAGDQGTLFGLYDIMQTLEIVPLDGPRERKNNSFVLIGESAGMISETRASLQSGEIKGFTLIWPSGDEERRRRMLGVMQNSFVRLDGTLDPAAGYNDEQAIDLVAGLEIRKPRISRSGFYVDARGTVVTTSDAVQSCARITLDEVYEAELLSDDSEIGIAVLSPKDALAPLNIAAFSAQKPRLQSEIAVAGYSYEGVLGSPSMTFGSLSDVRGLRGEDHLSRLKLAALNGDAGGPVLDASGGVMGMLLPKSAGGQQLPSDVSFALDRKSVQSALSNAGRNGSISRAKTALPAEDIAVAARGMTVLVSCWE
ncbi:trypsin-like peptidase domain-containing protein [Pseudosulfitobacter sp. SM2401]|uniref:serine protease n=1 Tax=Pseudosulfitobacter sp. SM2401 TaxID=3350098 RepID=UPI0036F3A4BD